ncbi:MAG: metallophosphoesterase, partial [Chloroflexota bacterium]
MKAAIIADIHGNSIALQNVLDDIQSLGNVDEYWFLGDYAAIGFDPLGVLESISSLPNTRFLRGNTDRYIDTGEMPWPEFADIKKDPALTELHIHVARSFAWTTGAVGAAGWLPWFKELRLDFHVCLPDGTKVLGVHAAPGTDDGMGININTSDEELRQLISDTDADIIFVGHTHIPFDRSVQEIRV